MVEESGWKNITYERWDNSCDKSENKSKSYLYIGLNFKKVFTQLTQISRTSKPICPQYCSTLESFNMLYLNPKTVMLLN